jgi:hypothetical protein
MREGVYCFRESGGYIVKNVQTIEDAVERLNSCYDPSESGGYEPHCDIGLYGEDAWTSRLHKPSDFPHSRIGWFRWVPNPTHDDDYAATYLHDAEPHARGAFPAVCLYG